MLGGTIIHCGVKRLICFVVLQRVNEDCKKIQRTWCFLSYECLVFSFLLDRLLSVVKVMRTKPVLKIMYVGSLFIILPLVANIGQITRCCKPGTSFPRLMLPETSPTVVVKTKESTAASLLAPRDVNDM